MRLACLVFASNLEVQHHFPNNAALWITTVVHSRRVLEVCVSRILGAAPATVSATSMRHVLEDHVKPCSPRILLAVDTGAMSILNAQFMKRVLTFIAFVVKLVNA